VETNREFCWNFVANWGGGGEDAHDRKERTAARGGKLLSFMEGGRGRGGPRKVEKNFSTLYPFLESRFPLALYGKETQP
jgi:hypothetical protein